MKQLTIILTLLGLYSPARASQSCWQQNWESGLATARLVQQCGRDSNICYSYCTEVRSGNPQNCASICGVRNSAPIKRRERSYEEEQALNEAIERARRNNCLMRPLCGM